MPATRAARLRIFPWNLGMAAGPARSATGGAHRHRQCPQRKLRPTPRRRSKRRAWVPLPAGLSRALRGPTFLDGGASVPAATPRGRARLSAQRVRPAAARGQHLPRGRLRARRPFSGRTRTLRDVVRPETARIARAGHAEPGLRRREAESGPVSGDKQRLTGTSGRRPASCESGETAGAGGGGPGCGSWGPRPVRGEGAGPAEALPPACRRLGFGRDPAVPLRGPGQKHGELPCGRISGAASFHKQNVVYDESDCHSLLTPATVGMSLTTCKVRGLPFGPAANEDSKLPMQGAQVGSWVGDGGVWWAAVYGVTQSRTRLKRLSSSSSSSRGTR